LIRASQSSSRKKRSSATLTIELHRERQAMSIAVKSDIALPDLRALHVRMGSVNNQPVRVRSFTNKRFTVNFRVPLEQLRRIVPAAIVDAARTFVFDLGGSCGYSYERDML
jgi:hypothetical protein